MRRHIISFILLNLALGSQQSLAEEAVQGEGLYRVYCAQCHGLEGDGYGVNAAYMAIQPKDHTETKEMNARTDDDLFKAIKFGGAAVGKSVLMPAWKNNMTDGEMRDLVAYLRVLSASDN